MISKKLYSTITRIVKKHLLESESSHDFDHTLRVCRNADKLLAELPEADSDVVRLATLLHDIARPEEKGNNRVCHAKLGAEMAEKILKDLKVEASFAQRVVSAVRTHRYRDDHAPETLEAQIVYDADKLDSLGAVGIGRAFLFAGKFGARLHNTEKEALTHRAYSKEDTAYREYLVKLRKLPEAMLTAPGKRMALERIVFMQEFFTRLNEETQLNLE